MLMTRSMSSWIAGLVLVAGCASPDAPAWERLETAAGIPPTWGHVAAYDEARDRMLVFGGQGDAGQSNEVWSLDMTTGLWSRLETGDGPGPRSDLGMFIDAPRDRMIIIGGRVGFSTSIDEVWALDLEALTWSRLPSGPSPRHDIPAVTDGAHGWVFGGAGELFQSLEDFWELDLVTDTWRQLPSRGPRARTSFAMAYWDGSIYLHGGHDVASVTRDTWRYDLETASWARLELPGGTIAGAHFGFSVDAACGTLMLSGGDNLDNYALAHSGALVLGEAPRFAAVEASELPPARDHATLVVDPLRRRMLLFGGGRLGDGLGTLADTWVYPLEGCL